MAFVENWRRFAAILTPVRMRVEWLIAILDVLSRPLQAWVNEKWDVYVRNEKVAREASGYKLYVEKLLNDKFNPGGVPPIWIEHNNNLVRTKKIRYRSEAKAPVYARYYSEGGRPNFWIRFRRERKKFVHFTVHVPDTISATDAEIRAIVDRYRVPGSIYGIVRGSVISTYPPVVVDASVSGGESSM